MSRRIEFDALCEYARQLKGIDIRYAKGKPGDVILIKAVIINIMIRFHKITLSELSIDFLHRKDHTYALYHRDNHDGRYKSDDKYVELYDDMVKFTLNRRTIPNVGNVDDILSLIKSIAA